MQPQIGQLENDNQGLRTGSVPLGCALPLSSWLLTLYHDCIWCRPAILNPEAAANSRKNQSRHQSQLAAKVVMLQEALTRQEEEIEDLRSAKYVLPTTKPRQPAPSERIPHRLSRAGRKLTS